MLIGPDAGDGASVSKCRGITREIASTQVGELMSTAVPSSVTPSRQSASR